MSVKIPLDLAKVGTTKKDVEILESVQALRRTSEELLSEERYMDALERAVEALRTLRDFSDTDNVEFRAMLVGLLFDLSEIHFLLKDFKQSEKELEMLFKVLDPLTAIDSERFGPLHILAMELSTRVLRSRKKTIDLLVKQQIAVGQLYEKVNSGVVAATDKLVDSLRNLGQLLAATGDYRAALKFFAEAIKYSKKRTGRVTRKEIKMTIEMAEIMIRIRHMRPRAQRLLNAILPHAIALETIELEEDIIALLEVIDGDAERESAWKTFVHKLNLVGKIKRARKQDKAEAKEAEAMEEAGLQDVHELDEAAEEAPKKSKKSKKK